MNNIEGYLQMLTKKRPFKCLWTDAESVNKLVQSIKNDQISIISTDTIPGFIFNLSQKTILAVNKIKGDRQNKPYLVLISDTKKLFYFVNESTLTTKMQNFLNACWPGPLTIIFKSKLKLPDFIGMGSNTVAIRCPQHLYLQKLLSNFDGLFSTSANKSGEQSPICPEKISLDIQEQVEYIIQDDCSVNANEPSTIIDLTQPEAPKLIREGAYPLTKLEEIYGTKFFK